MKRRPRNCLGAATAQARDRDRGGVAREDPAGIEAGLQLGEQREFEVPILRHGFDGEVRAGEVGDSVVTRRPAMEVSASAVSRADRRSDAACDAVPCGAGRRSVLLHDDDLAAEMRNACAIPAPIRPPPATPTRAGDQGSFPASLPLEECRHAPLLFWTFEQARLLGEVNAGWAPRGAASTASSPAWRRDRVWRLPPRVPLRG